VPGNKRGNKQYGRNAAKDKSVQTLTRTKRKAWLAGKRQ
jgi:hypothetical protein